MDDPLVQTQEDLSTTEDVVGLHSHVYYETYLSAAATCNI